MKTLKILVVGGDQSYRDDITTVMRSLGHTTYGARTRNQADAFVEENGHILDAIIIDWDTVPSNMDEYQRQCPNGCLVIQSSAYRGMEMPTVLVGTVLVSKEINNFKIEEYLQALGAMQTLENVA